MRLDDSNFHFPPNLFADCADKVEPEIMAHILSKDSCGLQDWLTAVPSDSHPEVIVTLQSCLWTCSSVLVALCDCAMHAWGYCFW